MTIRQLAFALFLLALGAAGGSWLAQPKPAAQEAISPELREKLQHLTEADIEEYYRLKDSAERYRKADEILGKIMTIFLADLGLRVSEHARMAAKEPFVPLSSSAPAQAPEARRRALPPPVSPAPVSAGPRDGRVRRAEAQITNARNENDAADALRRARLDDFGGAVAASGRFTNANLARVLNGQFAGRADVQYGGQHHDWDVVFSMQGTIAKGQLDGTARIRMSENGRDFSSFESKGGQSGFREIPGDNLAVLVQASPTVSFQLFYVRDLEQLAGNVYRREAEDRPYAYIGTIFLKRN